MTVGSGSDLRKKKLNLKIKSFLARTGVVWSLAVLFILLSVITEQFLTTGNLLNVMRQVTVTAILGVGITFVIIGGGIDLSVGSLLAVTGALAAGVVTDTGSMWLAFLTALITGIVFGFVQGFIVTRFKIAPFAVTLGGMAIFRGITLLYTDGIPISSLPTDFRWPGAGMVSGIPAPVIILFVVAVAAYILLGKTRIGRYIYAIGANENTTRLSGINVNSYRTLTYVISGICCAIAGVILVGRLNSAHPYAAQGYELNAIAAAVIGGTSLSGGMGTIYGTIIGALIIGIIQNGLNLLQVSAFWQPVVVGSVIIIAVLVDRVRINMTDSLAKLSVED